MDKLKAISDILDVKDAYIPLVRSKVRSDNGGHCNVSVSTGLHIVDALELQHSIDLIVYGQEQKAIKILQTLSDRFNEKAVDTTRSGWTGKPGKYHTAETECYAGIVKKLQSAITSISK